MKYHYIRDIVQKGVVKLQYISTDEQVTDIFTKPLARVKFAYFRERLGVVENPFIDKGCWWLTLADDEAQAETCAKAPVGGAVCGARERSNLSVCLEKL